MQNRSFLVTGGTGFVGGSIAAELINKGHKVVVVSRNDLSGERTFRSVKMAAEGLGLKTPVLGSSLNVYNYDDTNEDSFLKTLDDISENNQIHAVIHAAAEMSYSMQLFQKSLLANKVFTTNFYKKVSDCFKGCERFYYVSTAYSTGPVDFPIEEKVIDTQVLTNSYQSSKWETEKSLFTESQTNALPVTILRPSIVIGSRSNGWAHSKPFGFYMFLSGVFRAINKFKKNYLKVDLIKDNYINLVSIDQVNEAVTSLISSEKNQKKLEVVNLVPQNSENNKTGALLKLVGNALEAQLECGPPGSIQEKLLNKTIQLNKAFAKHSWNFKTGNYRRITGKEIRALTVDNIKTTINFYYRSNTLK